MKVRYVGMFEEVFVPEANAPYGLVVTKGQTIEVEEELGARLLEQPANWAEPGAKARASSSSRASGDTSE